MAKKQSSRYLKVINKLFFDRYHEGVESIDFCREDIIEIVEELGMRKPKNIGDVIYSYRYRCMSPEIIEIEPPGKSWTIFGIARSKYQFRLVKQFRILPREGLIVTKIPDATPEIVDKYSLTDEQGLLAKIRYNRLIDIFLGVTAYSLQNHLRTTLKEVGQIEIDEVYVAIDKFGAQYIVPVQAKRGRDQSSIVQTYQDMNWCKSVFPNLIPAPVSVQFMDENRIAMFLLKEVDDEIVIASERHYSLVEKTHITDEELKTYITLSENDKR